jgi:hypothetical protein
MFKTLLRIILVSIAAAATSLTAEPSVGSALTKALPAREVGILLAVGRDYGLSGDALRLLFAIRLTENGRPGVEMGVASNFPGHRARRYEGDFENSLRVQAMWAAGTINKHYTGDLKAFAKRYCPPNWERWSEMTRYWMCKA